MILGIYIMGLLHLANAIHEFSVLPIIIHDSMYCTAFVRVLGLKEITIDRREYINLIRINV